MSKLALHQVIAIVTGIKKQTTQAITELYKKIQKTEYFEGLNRTYTPREDEGYQYPSENKKLVLNATDIVTAFKHDIAELFDIAATQDVGNTVATSNIEIDGETLLYGVPVTTLLFLEKQLEDIKTFVSKLPTLPIDIDWKHDDKNGYYVSEKVLTTKTKKITKPIVLYEATKEHPAQVQMVNEDVVEGTWENVKLSGALSVTDAKAMLDRAEALRRAVVQARERANATEVERISIAKPLLDFVFG